ncbi:MAG: M48 family metallopeptidase [Azoarcus sp.]|nr:M48 family metallopeptidase [Azoarcus sp.]
MNSTASSFHVFHPRLFALRERLASGLTLIAAVALLTIPLLAALMLGGGLLAAIGVWKGLGGHWPLAALGCAGALLVAGGYAAVRLLSVLFVPLPEPGGVRIAPEDARDFHRLIEGMAWVLEADNIDHVWVTPDMNAAVLQRPRRGYFGRIETHLLVGLPLAHSVTCPQLVAVLAHEFAHLAVQRKGRGKYGALLRAWWLRVLDRIGDVFPFLGAQADRWLHRFYSNMARLARIEEFEADALATRLVDANVLGETLVEVSLREQFLLRDYWPRVLAQSTVRARPLMRPYRDLGLGMAAGFLRATAGGDLPVGDDPPQSLHPTTRERLSALRVSPHASSEDLPSAATHYFAPLLLTLAWVFDRAWWRDVRPDWQLIYQDARRQHKQNHQS